MMSDIPFVTDSNDPFIAYAIRLIKRFCGLQLNQISVSAPTIPDLYHGPDPAPGSRLRIPFAPAYTLQDISTFLSKENRSQPVVSDLFPFDIFSVLRFFLADEHHQALSDSAFDQHGRLRAENYLDHNPELREIPLVNTVLILFRDWLKTRLDVSTTGFLPEGKKCVVVLSHDVDSPVNFGDPAHALEIFWKRLKSGKLSHLRDQFTEIIYQFARKYLRSDQKWWLFDEVMAEEQRRGFKSTFFLAAVSWLDDYASSYDVRYDLEAPRFKKAFQNLVAQGFEIGLHTSYLAREHADRIQSEKLKLAGASGANIIGNRHHYWHLNRPFWTTLEDHQTAGLAYDSSLGFNDQPGYRLGVALPFYPWNPMTKREITTLQIPVMLMDAVYFNDPGLSQTQIMDHFETLLSNLKQNEGWAAIDWHLRTSYPGSSMYRAWGQAYLSILDRLAQDSEVQVMCGREVWGMVRVSNT